MNAITEVELIARHHIAQRINERTTQAPRSSQGRRRHRVASSLRRIADHLDE